MILPMFRRQQSILHPQRRTHQNLPTMSKIHCGSSPLEWRSFLQSQPPSWQRVKDVRNDNRGGTLTAGTQSISLDVNGRTARLTIDDPAMPLLYALRNDLGLHGPRFGCGLGQCGACTVHLDGAAIRSCVFPAVAAAGRSVVTLEGLGTTEKPHPLQQAFIDEQAVQCGYCINGMIMQSAAFVSANKHPTDDQIKQALAYNLCRCGTHLRIVRAVKRACSGT
jgi:nicotinate dehydrogenase subunit A